MDVHGFSLFFHVFLYFLELEATVKSAMADLRSDLGIWGTQGVGELHSSLAQEFLFH